MRICMISSTPIPPREGIGFYVWNLSHYLTALGHQVQIITRGQIGRMTKQVVDGITIWQPPFWPLYPFHVHFHGLFVDKLVQKLANEVDLFHLHTPLVKWPGSKKPALVTVHTPMKADAGSIPLTNWLGWLIKLQAPFSYRLEQQLFDKANKLTSVAHSVADELQAYQVDPQEVAVLGNGVDTNIFFPAQEARTPSEPYFLTAGRLAPRKGLKDLIRCAELVVKRYPTFRFLIAGGGPLENELKREIERRNLAQNVTLLGHIQNREQLVELYRGATAYVHAAHYEGLPTVLLEAMACGRPVVSTGVSGALDVVQNEQNGLLVPAKAPPQMAAALIRLIEQPNLAERLGSTAYHTIKERYAWQVVSRNYVAQYESLVEGGLS